MGRLAPEIYIIVVITGCGRVTTSKEKNQTLSVTVDAAGG